MIGPSLSTAHFHQLLHQLARLARSVKEGTKKKNKKTWLLCTITICYRESAVGTIWFASIQIESARGRSRARRITFSWLDGPNGKNSPEKKREMTGLKAGRRFFLLYNFADEWNGISRPLYIFFFPTHTLLKHTSFEFLQLSRGSFESRWSTSEMSGWDWFIHSYILWCIECHCYTITAGSSRNPQISVTDQSLFLLYL
jgi:hypothetical protein